MNENNIGWGSTRLTYRRIFWKLCFKDTGEGRGWKRFQLFWNNPTKGPVHTFDRIIINPPQK